MAKELPYFRFTAAEWLNDDISLESYEKKGLFIDVCAYYWSQDCDTTLSKLEKRFIGASDLLKQLIETDIIKHEKKHDKIKIDFLVTQYDLLSEKRKLRQSAGSKGGIATALLQQKGSYKDKDKDNNKDKEGFDALLALFSTILSKTFRSTKNLNNFNARIKEGFTLDNFKTALENIKKDSYHKETNYKHITPEFICRVDKLEKFLAVTPEKKPNLEPYEYGRD